MLALSKSQGADQTLQSAIRQRCARNASRLASSPGAAERRRLGRPAWRTARSARPQLASEQDVRVSAGNLPIWQSAAGPDTVTSGAESQWSGHRIDAAPIVEEAKLRWSEALGAGDSRLAALDSVTVQIATCRRTGSA